MPWTVLTASRRWCQQRINGSHRARAALLCQLLLPNLLFLCCLLFVLGKLPAVHIRPFTPATLQIAQALLSLLFLGLLACWTRNNLEGRRQKGGPRLLHGLSLGCSLGIALAIYATGGWPSPLLLWFPVNLVLLLLLHQGRALGAHLAIAVGGHLVLTLLNATGLLPSAPLFPSPAGNSFWLALLPWQAFSLLLCCLWLLAGILAANQRTLGRLRRLTHTDSLTGLRNRHQLEQQLNSECQRGLRQHVPMSVLMIDIDHFKQINDRFGHLAGDQILRRLGALFRQHARSYDLACRYGGEEFLLWLPATHSHEAIDIAERYRRLVEQQCFGEGPRGSRITISLGVASSDEWPRFNASELIHRADQALYRAKAAGRNCIYSASPNLASVTG